MSADPKTGKKSSMPRQKSVIGLPQMVLGTPAWTRRMRKCGANCSFMRTTSDKRQQQRSEER
jgi:hypothetical protein